jgi:leucyl/phenylalanyl-tRNA---protein transferase
VASENGDTLKGMDPLPFLLASPEDAPFPPAHLALRDPPGLLAVGGCLSATRMLNAYRAGIFPWYSLPQPILWWSPPERAVFRTNHIQLNPRMRRHLRNSGWVVRADTAFVDVLTACAAPRSQDADTWLTPALQAGYMQLHQQGHAHSIEVFADDQLVGGLMGVAVGQLFCADSMFSRQRSASTLAVAALAHRLHQWGWPYFDSQVANPHTQRFGVETWPRAMYIQALMQLRDLPSRTGSWSAYWGNSPAHACGV